MQISVHWMIIMWVRYLDVANPRAHQTQSRHSDVQGSSDVITAVHKFTAERSHPVTDAPTFQHAAPDRLLNHTCYINKICRTCGMNPHLLTLQIW